VISARTTTTGKKKEQQLRERKKRTTIKISKFSMLGRGERQRPTRGKTNSSG
jgi:hypothetical protein